MFVFLLALLPAVLPAQLVPRWIVSGKSQFTGIDVARGIDGCAGGFYITGGKVDNDFLLQVSEDGGRTWTNTLTLREYGFGAPQPPLRRAFAELKVNTVSRPTPAICFAYGRGSMEFNGAMFPFLLRSLDSGRTWTELDLPDSTRGVTEAWIAMKDATHGIRSGGHIDMEHSVLYRTEDGGESWTEVDIPFVDYRTNGLFYAPDGSLFAREWRTPTPLYRSTDGGDTWELRCELPASRLPCFASAELGWIAFGTRTGNGDVERDVIMRTTDGGTTWHTLMDTLHDPPFGLIAIDAATDRHVIAVGRLGKLLHSTDGGESWERAARPFYLYDPATVQVVHADTGTAVAGALLHIITYTGERTLPPPVVTTTQGGTTLQQTASWTMVPGAAEYQLELVEDYHTNTIQFEIFDEDPYKQSGWLTGTTLALDPWLRGNRDYFVRVRARGGMYTSDWSYPVKFYTDLSTGVDTPLPEGIALTLYPQPSTGAVLLSAIGLPQQRDWTVRVFDLLGCERYSGEGTSTPSGGVDHLLRLHGLPAGIYVLRLDCGEVLGMRPLQLVK